MDVDKFGWTPKCPARFTNGLVDIRQIDEQTFALWGGDVPTLHPIANHLDEGYVHALTLNSTFNSPEYNVFKDGKPQAITKVASDRRRLEATRFEAASRALSQTFFRGKVWRQEEVSMILNVQVTVDDIPLEPPEIIASRRHLLGLDRGVGINVCPKGAYVDLHYGMVSHSAAFILLIVGTLDEGLRGLSRTFGPCTKVWILFPGCVPENRALFHQLNGTRNILARAGDMIGGIVAKVDSSFDIELPAGALHAVFTLTGGFLAGINYTSIECLPMMGAWLEGCLESFQVNPKNTCADLDKYLKALVATMANQMPEHIPGATSSWLRLLPILQSIMDRQLSTPKLYSLLRGLEKEIKQGRKDLHWATSCGCGSYASDFGGHFLKNHLVHIES